MGKKTKNAQTKQSRSQAPEPSASPAQLEVSIGSKGTLDPETGRFEVTEPACSMQNVGQQTLTAEQAAAQWQAYAQQLDARNSELQAQIELMQSQSSSEQDPSKLEQENVALRAQVEDLAKQVERLAQRAKKSQPPPDQPKQIMHRIGVYDPENPRVRGKTHFPVCVLVQPSIEAAKSALQERDSALAARARLRYL